MNQIKHLTIIDQKFEISENLTNTKNKLIQFIYIEK